MVSMVWLVFGALWSCLEMLGHAGARDSRVHGEPPARATAEAQPRVGCLTSEVFPPGIPQRNSATPLPRSDAQQVWVRPLRG